MRPYIIKNDINISTWNWNSFFLFITNEFEVFRAQSHFDLIFHKNHFSWNRQKQPRLIMPSPYWTVSAWKNPFFVEIEKNKNINEAFHRN